MAECYSSYCSPIHRRFSVCCPPSTCGIRGIGCITALDQTHIGWAIRVEPPSAAPNPVECRELHSKFLKVLLPKLACCRGSDLQRGERSRGYWVSRRAGLISCPSGCCPLRWIRAIRCTNSCCDAIPLCTTPHAVAAIQCAGHPQCGSCAPVGSFDR